MRARRDGEMLNGGNGYLDDDPKMISGVARREVSPEAQKYAIASGPNGLLLAGAGDCLGMGNTRGARATIQFLFRATSDDRRGNPIGPDRSD